MVSFLGFENTHYSQVKTELNAITKLYNAALENPLSQSFHTKFSQLEISLRLVANTTNDLGAEAEKLLEGILRSKNLISLSSKALDTKISNSRGKK